MSNLLPCVTSNVTEWTTTTDEMCPPLRMSPSQKIFNMDNYVAHPNHRFAHSTVLYVGCLTNNKIAESIPVKCRRGKWSWTRKLKCDNVASACEMKLNIQSHVAVFDPKRKENVLFNQFFEAGSRLLFRCIRIGTEKLQGKNEVVCRDGNWSHPIPYCVPLRPTNRNSVPIRHAVSDGTYAISPKGELIVSRAANVALTCMSRKTLPDPVWKVTSTYRTYPTQWTSAVTIDDETIDAFEISIASAQPYDSGLLHCVLPTGVRNSIKLIVNDRTCAQLHNSSQLQIHLSGSGLFIGAVAQFSCPEGYSVIGNAISTCLPDATWSHPLPKCVAAQCPNIVVNGSRLFVSVTSFRTGGVAQFRCHKGYTLIGEQNLHCTKYGTWSHDLPKCNVVRCNSLEPPQNGYTIGEPKQRYFKGDIVLFGCLPNHLLTGGDFSICQADGQWSDVLTKCEAYCRHPGRPDNGATTSAAKDYYVVGEKIVFYCPSPHYKLSSENVLVCVAPGQWSRKLPLCLPSTTVHARTPTPAN